MYATADEIGESSIWLMCEVGLLYIRTVEQLVTLGQVFTLGQLEQLSNREIEVISRGFSRTRKEITNAVSVVRNSLVVVRHSY